MLNECIEWRGARTRHGYGVKYVKGKLHYTHRLAFAWANGREPRGMVLHTCDNPPCCNPLHLREGTQKDNMRDAANKDRIRFGDNSPVAVLTTGDVERIFELRRFGIPIHRISEHIGISRAQAGRVLNGERWRRYSVARRD